MAGIYIHVPFCRKACHYCDFHFSVSLDKRSSILQCLKHELETRSDYLGKRTPIDSVYFGGGTPTVLSLSELDDLRLSIEQNYAVDEDTEWCIEANPDDLEKKYVKGLKLLGFSRLSIGVQSTDDGVLKWMNRSHTADQAKKSIAMAADSGFQDISVDLIYGVPMLRDEAWRQQVQEVFEWPINHLSAYSLTMEERTKYALMVKKNLALPPDDSQSVAHYRILQAFVQERGWDQYEISNYCKPEHYSKHNTAYWKNQPYLGIGPSAHSYDGKNRRWNVSSNAAYIQAIDSGASFHETEVLSVSNMVNEYLLTGLRTKWGVNRRHLKQLFGHSFSEEDEALIQSFVFKKLLVDNGQDLILNSEGMLFADQFSASLFTDYSSQMSS